jgi:hypothetical protein
MDHGGQDNGLLDLLAQHLDETVIDLFDGFTEVALGNNGFYHGADIGKRNAVFVKARLCFSEIHHLRADFLCCHPRLGVLGKRHCGPALKVDQWKNVSVQWAKNALTGIKSTKGWEIDSADPYFGRRD